MIRAPRTAAAAALCALAVAGCGVGGGDDAGEIELTVTRDYGTQVLLDETEPVSESDTVIRVLDRNAELETRYGGGFVQSVDGLAGGESGGRRSDWFFYVNGIESPIGGAEYQVADGDRVWWDHRDWTSAMRVPAVVGSWPEPFVHGFRGERWSTELDCRAPKAVCDVVSKSLSDEGVVVDQVPGGGEAAIRVLVGTWNKIRSDADAGLLAEGPARSGVFATLTGPGPVLLNLLNRRGEPAGSIGSGGGLVAAMRPNEGPPTWVITGTDRRGVEDAAVELYSAPAGALENRYAVAVDEAGPVGVPVP